MPLTLTPLATSQAGYPGQSLTVGQPASEARDNAIAAAEGQPAPDASQDPQVKRVSADSRKLKMRTKMPSTQLSSPAPEAPQAPAPEAAAQSVEAPAVAEAAPAATLQPEPQSAPGANPDSSSQATAAADTKPLSPQYVALQRQRRALQVKEREIQAREQALASKSSSPDGSVVQVARLKSDPLSVLQEAGVSYEQLTEAVLNQNTATPEINKLKQELKTLQEQFMKTLSERDTQAETAALSEIRREAQRLSTQGDAYELVRQTNSVSDVVELIHRTYKQTGEVLDTHEAMQLVENELLSQSLALANSKKVQGKLKPAAPPPAPAPQAANQQQQPKPMKTLTSSGTASAPMSRRDRAIAAMTGMKK